MLGIYKGILIWRTTQMASGPGALIRVGTRVVKGFLPRVL